MGVNPVAVNKIYQGLSGGSKVPVAEVTGTGNEGLLVHRRQETAHM
jgi:hypothetical protein